MADVIVYSMVEWHYRWQRPQQIPSSLAELGHRVFYVSNSFSVQQTDHPYEIALDAERNVHLVWVDVPGNPPNAFVGNMSAEQSRSVALSINALVRDFGLVEPIAIVQHPFWAPVLERLPQQFAIYDCMDHHVGFGDEAPHLHRLEAQLTARADYVVATSQWIAKESQHPHVTVIPNAVDFEHFSPIVPRLRDDSTRPVIGYYGAIAHWFDFDYLKDLANLMPECDFHLGGEVSAPEVAKIESLSNVRFFGEIPYKEVPQFAATFDVALIPFKIIDLTLATNPVKIFEYAAMGLPTVATKLPELLPLPQEVVSICEAPNEAAEAIRHALSSDQTQRVSQRKKWASKQTWRHRAEAFENILAAHRKLVSIIVLTYNKWELTQACLENIDSHTAWPHEIVVVDNASSDGTPEKLTNWAAKGKNRRVVLSTENLGFAGGNNLGIENTSGEYLILLNNDTEVTDGWLTPLIRVLEREPRVGIVGPATNNSGNEARVDLRAAKGKALASAVAAFIGGTPPQFLETNSVAFFCVALRRETVNEIGVLDTAYGIGMFEDDDYCQRLKKAGYVTGVCFQSFVFHHMSASFNEMGEAKTQLFEKNKATFESQWGPWEPHQHLNPLPIVESPNSVSQKYEEEIKAKLRAELEVVRATYTHQYEARASVERERIGLINELQRHVANQEVLIRQLYIREEQLMIREEQLMRDVRSYENSRALKVGKLVLLPLRILRKVVRVIRARMRSVS